MHTAPSTVPDTSWEFSECRSASSLFDNLIMAQQSASSKINIQHWMERHPTPTEVQGPSVVRYSVLLLLFFLKEKNISLYPRLCHRQNRKINRSPSNTCHWFHFLPGSISREYHFHPKWKGSGLLSEREKRAWLTQGMCCVCLLCSDAIPAHSTAKDWALRGQIGKDVTLALVMLQIFF